MAKRRYAMDKMKIVSEELAVLPKLMKISIYLAAIALFLACLSIYFQIQSMHLLGRVETKHRTFMNRITTARMLGDISQLSSGKRSLDGAEREESEQQQCRHRQKTEWVYYDADTIAADGTITVDFTAAEDYFRSKRHIKRYDCRNAGLLTFEDYTKRVQNDDIIPTEPFQSPFWYAVACVQTMTEGGKANLHLCISFGSVRRGYVVSTASCASSVGSVKALKQTGNGMSKIYHCMCKADVSQLRDDHLGYEKLTCTANYWECPMK